MQGGNGEHGKKLRGKRNVKVLAQGKGGRDIQYGARFRPAMLPAPGRET